MCDVISCSNTVVTTRGQEGFTPVGIALLQQERDKAQAAEAQRDVDAQNPTVTDDDLDRTFSVLNPKRKQMGGKIFVSFFKFKCRVWWVPNTSMGVSKIEPVTPDANFTCYKLTIHWKCVIKRDTVDSVANSMAAEGWKTLPYEKYFNLEEHITVKLPYRICFPKTDAALNAAKRTGTNWKGFEFTIASDCDEVQDEGLERDDNGLV